MIKYIINVVYSKTDIYGNRYSYATLTSAATGKSITLQSGYGENQLKYWLARKEVNLEQLSASESEIGIRDFNRQTKKHEVLA